MPTLSSRLSTLSIPTPSAQTLLFNRALPEPLPTTKLLPTPSVPCMPSTEASLRARLLRSDGTPRMYTTTATHGISLLWLQLSNSTLPCTSGTSKLPSPSTRYLSASSGTSCLRSLLVPTPRALQHTQPLHLQSRPTPTATLPLFKSTLP